MKKKSSYIKSYTSSEKKSISTSNLQLHMIERFKKKLKSPKFKYLKLSNKCFKIMLTTNKILRVENLCFLIKVIDNLFLSLTNRSKKSKRCFQLKERRKSIGKQTNYETKFYSCPKRLLQIRGFGFNRVGSQKSR